MLVPRNIIYVTRRASSSSYLIVNVRLAALTVRLRG